MFLYKLVLDPHVVHDNFFFYDHVIILNVLLL